MLSKFLNRSSAPPQSPQQQRSSTTTAGPVFVSFDGAKKSILVDEFTTVSQLLVKAEDKFQPAKGSLSRAFHHDGHSQEAELDPQDLVLPYVVRPGAYIIVRTENDPIPAAIPQPQPVSVLKAQSVRTPPSVTQILTSPPLNRGNTRMDAPLSPVTPRLRANISSLSDDETFVALNRDAKKYGDLDVMLSINCETMEESALWLKQELEARGVTVWVCTTELKGGANFRDDIFHAVKGCRVIIPFINEKWANSGECDYEFALAIRTNLISHDSGKTHRVVPVEGKDGRSYAVPGIRRPAFLPLKFPDIQWTAKPAIEQLSCSTNFIVCDGTNLLDPEYQNLILPKILYGLYNLGIAITPLESDPPMIPMTKRSLQHTTNPIELAQQVITGIQYQLSNSQDLFTLVSRHHISFENTMKDFELESLYENYLGYSANDRNGCHTIWSLEFKIKKIVTWEEGDDVPFDVRVTGTLTANLMSLSENPNPTRESDKEYARLSPYVDKQDATAVAQLSGTFFRRRGLVLLDADEIVSPPGLLTECKYRLVLQHDVDGTTSESGRQALGLFSAKEGNESDEWTSVIRLVAE